MTNGPGVAATRLLEVSDLRIRSRFGGVVRTITNSVSLRVDKGETLGIVGESGSGKSMTGRAIMGLLPAGVQATGSVRYLGREILGLRDQDMTAVRGRQVGMIFQDPFTMLNPLMRCGEQIVELVRDEAGRRLGRRQRRAEAVMRLAEVGIKDAAVAHAYPFQLSGGMRQRVGIAAVLALNPSLVIADEPSTALDVTTQRDILARLHDLQESRGMGLILITHDLRVAFSICDRIDVLYAGSVLERSPAAAMDAEPRHPYTLGLLLSEPPGERRLASLTAIPGSVPDPGSVANSCAFAARCAWRKDECTRAAPELAASGPDRESACLRLPEIGDELDRVRHDAEQPVSVPVPGIRAGSMPLVSVRGLVKTFDDRTGRTVRALRGVSIDIGEHESVGVVGESGSGKTTLGRCVIGLERPSAGEVTVDGIDLSDFERLARPERQRLRRTVQMIFQDPYSTLNPVRTVAATLGEALSAGDADGRRNRAGIARLLDLVGLPSDYAKRKPVALSGGERQRVGVARALAVRPKLIVCDEAVSALDVSVQAQILNLLAALHRELGISYLFISHDLAVVRQIADRVYVLLDGEVVEEGSTDDILDRPQHPYTRRLVASIPQSSPNWLAVGPQP